MSSEESKSGADTTVLYWPIPWRGHFLKIVLEYAGAAYKVAPMPEVMALFKSADNKTMLAPPFLKVGAFAINQMPAAAQYLARKHGLDPESPENSALALKCLLDLNDFLMEITRNNGHQMWDDEAWAKFVTERGPRWLAVFNGQAGFSGGDKFMFGDAVSYADLAIAHTFRMLCHNLGLNDWVKKHAPVAHALYERVSALDKVKAFFAASDEAYGTHVCGGQIEASIRKYVAKNVHKSEE